MNIDNNLLRVIWCPVNNIEDEVKNGENHHKTRVPIFVCPFSDFLNLILDTVVSFSEPSHGEEQGVGNYRTDQEDEVRDEPHDESGHTWSWFYITVKIRDKILQ